MTHGKGEGIQPERYGRRVAPNRRQDGQEADENNMKKQYQYFVWRCEESTETRGRTTQDRAVPCHRWAVHRTRKEGDYAETLNLKPRAKCKHNHGDEKGRRQYLTNANIAPENCFDSRWDAQTRAAVLNDREESQ